MNISDKRHSMLLRAAVLLACAAPALPLPRYLIEGVYSQNTAQRFAGEGRPAVQAYLEPACLAVAPDDAVYVCVPVYSRIVRIGSDGIVRTAAGGGALSPKDGLDAATVAINASTIAVSPAGQLYFNHGGLIFRLESSGKLKLIAGGGQALPDDEGPATNAATTTVQFLTFGSDGTLYFHDLYNYRIRAVDAGGIIRTIAGASTSWPIAGPARAARVMCTGLGIDAAGNLYWATGAVSENGFVTFGLFWIFKLVRATNTIVRLDNPSATTDLRSTTSFSKLKLGEVSDLTVDSQGRIYIARSGYLDAYASDRARKALYELALFRLDPVSDAIEHVAGNGGRGWATSGDALKTPLARPTRVAVNSKGAVWFIDHAAIKKVQAGLLSWVGGAFSGPAVGEDGDVSAAQLHTIQDIAYSQSGELHFSDKATHTVWKIDSQNRLRRVAGNGIPNFSGDGGPATQASLFQPWGVCFDSSNNLYIADKYNGRIRKVTPSGIISTVAGDLGGKADPDGGSANLHTLIAPMHCAGDRNGNIYYVQSNGGGYLVDLSEGQVVYRLSPAGTATRMTAFQYAPGDFDGKPARDAFLQGPRGMAFDSKGNLYITERRNSRIRKVSPEGIITTFAGGGPKADDFGDNGPATSADLNYPDDVAVDAAASLPWQGAVPVPPIPPKPPSPASRCRNGTPGMALTIGA
jgi:sugar lactone lactonase YvrE